MGLKNIKKYQSPDYLEYVFEQKWTTILNKLEACKTAAKLKFTQGLRDEINKKIVDVLTKLDIFGVQPDAWHAYIVSEKEFNAEKNRKKQDEYRRIWVDSTKHKDFE